MSTSRLYWLLHHFYVSEEYDRVFETVERIQKEDKTDLVALYYRGLALKAAGRLSEALSIFKQGSQVDSCHKLLFIEAITKCERLLANSSETTILSVPLQTIDNRKTLAAFPHSGALQSHLATEMWQSPAASLALAEKSARLEPLNAVVQLNRGLLLKTAGTTASAVRALAAAGRLGHAQAAAELQELMKNI